MDNYIQPFIHTDRNIIEYREYSTIISMFSLYFSKWGSVLFLISWIFVFLSIILSNHKFRLPIGLTQKGDTFHIALVGDSVMRYNYLLLCDILKHGQRESGKKSFFAWHYGGFNYFFGNVSNYLDENFCDCYRTGYTNSYIMLENRICSKNHVTVSYFQWFGKAKYPDG